MSSVKTGFINQLSMKQPTAGLWDILVLDIPTWISRPKLDAYLDDPQALGAATRAVS